jgi:ferrous iron transport protein A
MKIPLSELKEGQKGRLLRPQKQGLFHRRLMEFGMIQGTEICCLGRSPLGSPMLFRLRGTVLALRKQDCKGLAVEVEP